MSGPAGVQIRFWILFLGAPLILVDRAAMWGSVGVLGVSTLALLALHRCWKRFRETVLGFQWP